MERYDLATLVSARYHRFMAMTLRLTEEESQRLAELADAEGRTKQDVVREALAQRWERQHKEQGLHEAMERILPRYQGLLERFGTA
jgi:predicted DNA-binding protein